MRTQNDVGILLKWILQKKYVAIKTIAMGNRMGDKYHEDPMEETVGVEVTGSYLQWSSCLHHIKWFIACVLEATAKIIYSIFPSS